MEHEKLEFEFEKLKDLVEQMDNERTGMKIWMNDMKLKIADIEEVIKEVKKQRNLNIGRG